MEDPISFRNLQQHCNSLSLGKCIYRFNRVDTIALHVSWTTIQAAHRAMPNKWPIGQYSALVARNHNVIATLLFIVIGSHILVFFFLINGASVSHRISNVDLLTLIQSLSVNVRSTMYLPQSSDLITQRYMLY